MTSITLTVTGAKARAAVNGPLTSGMVGIPVTIEYDDSWEGLTKNLVCRCSKWSSGNGETRTVLGIETNTTVAHEVMQADMQLYLGVEGYSPEGKLVIPTTWAKCGTIQPGANSDVDPSADPKLSVWAQLQTEINQIKAQGITEDQIAAGIAAYLEENPIEVPEAPQSSALNTAQITALDNLFRVCAFTKADVSAEYAAFKTAFGITDSGEDSGGDSGGSGEDSGGDSGETEVTLTSISATYSGGEVTVGTAVTDLTGIVVTAHYSDGTSQTVTGYTLSGTIAEGSNTVTVSYQGKTTTFTVTGVAESGGDDSGGEETGVSNETTWADGVDYTFTPIMNEYPDKTTGELKAYNNWTRTPYLYCEGASKLRVTATASTSSLNSGVNDNAFYDADKKYVSGFSYSGLNSVEPGTYVEVDIPDNAAYFILSGPSGRFPDTGGTTENGCITLTPYA